MTQMNVRKPTNEEIKQTENWDFWSKEPSEFPWTYSENEICYIIEGKAEVIAENGETISLKKGDWVSFEKGLNCTWKITEEIRKKYIFK